MEPAPYHLSTVPGPVAAAAFDIVLIPYDVIILGHAPAIDKVAFLDIQIRQSIMMLCWIAGISKYFKVVK